MALKTSEVRSAVAKWGTDEVRRILRDQRKQLSVTQNELATRSGVNRSVIAKWELRELDLSIDQLTKVWNALTDAYVERHAVLDTGKTIGELRSALGMTQRQLADLARVRQETVSRAETGDLNLSGDTFERIMDVLLEASRKKREQMESTSNWTKLSDLGKRVSLYSSLAEGTTATPSLSQSEIEALMLDGESRELDRQHASALEELDNVREQAFKQLAAGVRKAKGEADIPALRELVDIFEQSIQRHEKRVADVEARLDEVEAKTDAIRKGEAPKC